MLSKMMSLAVLSYYPCQLYLACQRRVQSEKGHYS
jgi:hypothetical protein